MKNDLVSIIVPVYNVEQYLPRCLDSILSQTYNHLEILLVDDGSSDNSGRICDAYAQKDPRIQVIHKENEGPGPARNAALDVCTGAYIMFVDSDDYISLDAVQVLYERMVADGSDMAVGKHVDAYEDGRLNEHFCSWMKDAVVSKEKVLETIGSGQRITVFTCVKMFRHHLFEQLRYPSLKCGEDLWIIPRIIDKCNKISIINHLIYYYVQHPTSILHQPTDQRILDDVRSGLTFVQYLLAGGYRKSAIWWFAAKVDKALWLRDKQAGCALFEEILDRKEIRGLLKAAGVKTRVKWLALHHPVIHFGYQSMRKILKRG